MIIGYLRVKENRQIAKGIFETVLDCGEGMLEVFPGQFISIYPKNPILTLPRPISICDADERRLRIVYRVAGNGTEEFSKYAQGEEIKAMYPLGNGYTLDSTAGKNAILVGGGLGIPPLLLLAKRLKARGVRFSVFLGYANETFLTEEFKQYSENVFISTDTGTAGEKGTVSDLLTKYDNCGEIYFSCGPEPMLKAVCSYISEKGAVGQVSLEQRMACGFGVCIGCAVKITRDGGNNWQYLKACKDGPVFDSKEVFL